MVGVADQSTGNAPEKPSVILDDILKVVSEQGKAIGEPVNAVRESVNNREKSSKGGRPKFQFTENGKPICFKCGGVGHIARECKSHNKTSHPTASNAPPQGN